MRIISQDGTMDTPYESCTVWVGEMNGAFIYAQNIGEDERVTYATYSTPEKAKKAMGMLRKAYTGKVAIFQNIEPTDEAKEEFERCNIEIVHSELVNRPSEITVENYQNFYFRFPKDEELE